MAIQAQEFVLLKNVPDYNEDHLLTEILDGHIHAYVDFKSIAWRFLPMGYKGTVHRYARVISSANIDDKGKLFFGQVAILSENGSTISKPKDFFETPIGEVRISIKELNRNKLKSRDVFWNIVRNAADELKREKGKILHKELFKELKRLAMDSGGVAKVITEVDIDNEIIVLFGEDKEMRKTVSFKTVRNKIPIK